MGICTEKYVSKIATASPLKLVIINFEIIFDYLEESKNYIDTKDNLFNFNIKKARDFLLELRSSLDMQYEISHYLLKLYNYVDKKLAQFLFSKNIDDLDEALYILTQIMSSFEQIEEEDKNPIMENTETLYAGLTYDKSGRLQEFVDLNGNRGFKA